jgi:flavin reductase (DIM6/NTAB) family NADH-FMN oxidoreductase RutF
MKRQSMKSRIVCAVACSALLDGALAHLECHTHERTPGGDHSILMGAVDAAHVGNGAPLLYVRNRYGRFET